MGRSEEGRAIERNYLLTKDELNGEARIDQVMVVRLKDPVRCVLGGQEWREVRRGQVVVWAKEHGRTSCKVSSGVSRGQVLAVVWPREPGRGGQGGKEGAGGGGSVVSGT